MGYHSHPFKCDLLNCLFNSAYKICRSYGSICSVFWVAYLISAVCCYQCCRTRKSNKLEHNMTVTKFVLFACDQFISPHSFYGQFAQFLNTSLCVRKVYGWIPGPVKLDVVSQRLATAVTFLRSDVAQARSRGDGLRLSLPAST